MNKNLIYQLRIAEINEIKPKGWIKAQLERDLTEGYIGHYDKVNDTVDKNLFVKQNRRSKRVFSLRKEWWSGEHEGYWKDAVIRMAFLTDNEEYIEKAHQWINEIIDAADDGYIGIYDDSGETGSRFNHKSGDGELWTTSRILMALLAYYEYTGKADVLKAAEKAAQLIIEKYDSENYFGRKTHGGGVSHAIGFFEILEWLYRLTEKKMYLLAAMKFYSDFNNGSIRDDDLKTEKLLDEDELFRKHGAHVAEGLFIPQFIASISEDEEFKIAAENTLKKLKKHLTPGGAMRCDEWVKGKEGTADERYEYCGIAEMVSPLLRIVMLTRKFELADIIEKMTFNAGQGSRFPVLSALSYLTADNRKKIRRFEIAGRESYDASHVAAACCALNGGRLMPYYVEGMWMKDINDEGITALLLGPSEFHTRIKNTEIKIVEETDYPFSDEIRFTVKTAKEVYFPFIIRKSHGCKKVSYKIPDAADLQEDDDKIIIKNHWNNNDSIQIKFNFEIQKIDQPKSKTVKKEGIYLKRGALVFALPFDYESRHKKEYHNSGFFRYRLKTTDTKDWNLKLHPDDEFEYIAIDKNETTYPWDEPIVSLKGNLRTKKGKQKEVNLVPLGNTVFRRVTFSKYK